MRFCKRCVEPDTRPDCIFDDEGICYPCRYREILPDVDRDERRRAGTSSDLVQTYARPEGR